MSGIVCKCGSSDYRTEVRGPHVGAYCNVCNKFIKWVPKTSSSKTNSVVNNSSIGACTTGYVHKIVSDLPEPVRGTEKLQIHYTSTSELVLRMDGKQYRLYNAEGMHERPRIVVKHNMDKLELLAGDTLDVYVM